MLVIVDMCCIQICTIAIVIFTNVVHKAFREINHDYLLIVFDYIIHMFIQTGFSLINIMWQSDIMPGQLDRGRNGRAAIYHWPSTGVAPGGALSRVIIVDIK